MKVEVKETVVYLKYNDEDEWLRLNLLSLDELFDLHTRVTMILKHKLQYMIVTEK